MSNENHTDGATEHSEELGGDQENEASAKPLTRNWPAPKPDGDDLMNPLVEGDFDEIFSTTVNQAFPSEEDLKSDDEKAGPEDTAEDPIPQV